MIFVELQVRIALNICDLNADYYQAQRSTYLTLKYALLMNASFEPNTAPVHVVNDNFLIR